MSDIKPNSFQLPNSKKDQVGVINDDVEVNKDGRLHSKKNIVAQLKKVEVTICMDVFKYVQLNYC